MRLLGPALLALGCLTCAQVTAAAPPTRLDVRIGDQRILLEAGQTVEVHIDGKPIKLHVAELPTRQFADAGIRFEYPRHFPWEHEPARTWTLDGNNAVVIVTQGDKGEDTTADELLDGIEENLKQQRKGPRERVVLETRQGRVSGVATTITLASSRLRNEAYVLEGTSTLVILLLQDSLDDDGHASAEFIDMRKRLAATLEF